ncbi:MAG TPA: TonB-dependent receptor plug domain-containing protein, partial [Burkholderiaceae bacterium]
MKLNKLAQSLALIGIGAVSIAAIAQTTPPPAPAAKPIQKVERVEVTGSSIKRFADEGALPLEVISADDMKQAGIENAEDLLRQLSANSANADNSTSRNNVFGGEQDRLTGGASFANLRGLGPTGTLVLLNGRRLSNQGLSGGAVDLSAIPLEMVQRVEVLKDGASAIYGTDAIGGVINYILKKEYNGLTMNGQIAAPQADGGGLRRKIGIAGGFGKL